MQGLLQSSLFSKELARKRSQVRKVVLGQKRKAANTRALEFGQSTYLSSRRSSHRTDCSGAQVAKTSAPR